MATTKINETVTINGLDNLHETIEIKPLEIKPLEIKPLNLTTKSELAVTQPIVTDSKTDSAAKLDLKIEPLKIESDQRSAIDVKPLAIDACQTLKLAPLPPTCIDQPYQHHFGFTLMGVEMWGFNISGGSQMNLRSPEPCHSHGVKLVHEHQHCNEPARQHKSHGAGIRVRVGGGSAEPQK
jgi:hypothetical protein